MAQRQLAGKQITLYSIYMADFEIIGVPDSNYIDWFLDTSAKRGTSEVRIATPWGAKLARIDNYRLAQETSPDDTEFIFAGQLGRFAVVGMASSTHQAGSLSVEITELDEPELLVLLEDDKPMTPTEYILGWDT